MKLTETLSSEHRVIEQAILALDAAADLIEGGGQVRPGFFQDAAGFIAGFADGYHHAKEERVLFEAMARHGVPVEGGPIAVMLHEHDEGRRLTAGLRDAAARLASGDATASDVVADYARAYGERLRQHIFKEDNILFPMAVRVIAPGAWDDILREAERVEAERAGGDSKTYYVHLARALCEEMGVDPAAAHGRPVELPCHARQSVSRDATKRVDVVLVEVGRLQDPLAVRVRAVEVEVRMAAHDLAGMGSPFMV